MPLFAAQRLTRSPFFRERSLSLAAGELRVVRGPSGSGKSLFLRALADLDPVDAGEVRLEDRLRESWRPAEWRRRVLYLHQRPGRLGRTVAEELDAVTSLGVHAGRAALAPPPDLLPHTSSDHLSGGEAQGLALHRALLLEPRVLLADEPTSALDPARAREAEERVRAWATASGAACLWVSHDPDLAGRLGAAEVSFP